MPIAHPRPPITGPYYRLRRPSRRCPTPSRAAGPSSGAVVLAAAPVAALAPSPAAAATPSPADARLLALADAYEALERRCHEHTAAHRHLRGRALEIAEAEFGEIAEGFLPIEEEVTATPADSLAGVLAKARMCQVPSSRHSSQFEHVLSVADDLHRLFGGRHG